MMGSKDIHATLTRMSEVFPEVAIDCLASLLERDTTVNKPWTVSDHIDFSADFILTLGSASKHFQAIVAIGINFAAIDVFVGDHLRSRDITQHLDEAGDIFGELANTYCAMLTDNDVYRKNFGVLTQSVPTLYIDGKSYFPPIPAIQGECCIGDSWLSMAHGIRKNPGR